MGTDGRSELPMTIDPELKRVNARLFQAPDFKVRWIRAAALQRDIRLRVRQRMRIGLKNLAAVLNVSLTIVPSLDLDPAKVCPEHLAPVVVAMHEMPARSRVEVFPRAVREQTNLVYCQSLREVGVGKVLPPAPWPVPGLVKSRLEFVVHTMLGEPRGG